MNIEQLASSRGLLLLERQAGEKYVEKCSLMLNIRFAFDAENQKKECVKLKYDNRNCLAVTALKPGEFVEEECRCFYLSTAETRLKTILSKEKKCDFYLWPSRMCSIR